MTPGNLLPPRSLVHSGGVPPNSYFLRLPVCILSAGPQGFSPFSSPNTRSGSPLPPPHCPPTPSASLSLSFEKLISISECLTFPKYFSFSKVLRLKSVFKMLLNKRRLFFQPHHALGYVFFSPECLSTFIHMNLFAWMLIYYHIHAWCSHRPGDDTRSSATGVTVIRCHMVSVDGLVSHQWKERPISRANFICSSIGERQGQEVGVSG
jgi:hypothetical protein